MFATPSEWQGNDGTVFTPVLLTGLVALLGLFIYLGSRLAPRVWRQYTQVTALRDVSLLAITAASVVYLWGFLHIPSAEYPKPVEACEEARPSWATDTVGTTADYIPLRFICHLSDERSFTAAVPAYINPTIAVLLLLALACGARAALLQYRERTATRKKG